jgi:hypothetical protein
MDPQEVFALVFVAGMIAGVLVILMAMRQRSQQLEMLHRERMAMIERGQNPSQPAPDPSHWSRGGAPSGSRSLSLGIVVVALGLSLMTIISIAAGSPETGIGVGGAIAIVGAGFIVNSQVSRYTPPRSTPPSAGMPPMPPSDRLPE